MSDYTLAVPDIHQRIDKLERDSFVKLYDQAHAVVFLGDYYDSHEEHKYRHTHVTHWLRQRTDKDTLLVGNHDCQYLYNHPGFRCSGWQGHDVKRDIQQGLNHMLDKFKLHTWVGPYLLSHAGWHPWTMPGLEAGETMDLVKAEIDHNAEQALRCARQGSFHWLFFPGADVGGEGFGGPTWMRWKRYVPIPGLPQIMGHTWQRDGKVKVTLGNGEAVKGPFEAGHLFKPTGLMLDTGLKHVAKINHIDWSVEVVKL